MKTIILILLFASLGFGKTYFYNKTNKLNEIRTLKPGDTVLFKGGDTIGGSAVIQANFNDSSQKIVLGSYGTGKAILLLDSSAKTIFWLYTTKTFLFEIRNLIFIGRYDARNQRGGDVNSRGIWLMQYATYRDSDEKNLYLNIDSCEFRNLWYGVMIEMWSFYKRGTYRITNSKFNELGLMGIVIYGVCYSDFLIRNNTFKNIYSRSDNAYGGGAVGGICCRSIIIRKNTVDGCGKYANIGGMGMHFAYSRKITADSNTIQNVYRVSNEGDGIYVADCGGDSNYVNNNRILNCQGSAINLANYTSEGFICGTTRGMTGFDEDSLGSSFNVAFYNIIYTNAKGIRLNGHPLERYPLKNNLIKQNSIFVGRNGFGIYQTGKSDGLVISGNAIHLDSGATAIKLDKTPGFVTNTKSLNKVIIKQ